MAPPKQMIIFPAHALLILEERLQERQEAVGGEGHKLCHSSGVLKSRGQKSSLIATSRSSLARFRVADFATSRSTVASSRSAYISS
jgi:hypothetical protein